MNFIKRAILFSLAASIAFSSVYANSLSKKEKVGYGIGIGAAAVIAGGVVIYALANDYSKTHKIDLNGYDTSNWKNRYELLTPDEKITPKSYNGLYMSQGADYRYLYRGWQDTGLNSNSPTVALDKQFVNKVMERRFAHLQQCIHYIKLYENEIRRNIKIKHLDEKAVWDPEAVREFDDFMDNLVKILNSRPAAIPDLKFSDKLLQNAEARIQEYIESCERGVRQTAQGNKNEKLMLVSHERTDKILATFANFAKDSDNLDDILELFGETVGIPQQSTKQHIWWDEYLICKSHLGEYDRLISSSKLSNPYRTLYTYNKSLI